MDIKNCLIPVTIMMLTVPFASHAGSLECQGNIISQGDTEQQLLDACGEPTSRDGANWTYQVPGSIAQVVTLGDGLIMFIRDADQVDTSGTPMEDHP